MEIDLAELKHVSDSESDQSTRNIASKLGCSQKGIHYLFKQFGLVPNRAWYSTLKTQAQLRLKSFGKNRQKIKQ